MSNHTIYRVMAFTENWGFNECQLASTYRRAVALAMISLYRNERVIISTMEVQNESYFTIKEERFFGREAFNHLQLVAKHYDHPHEPTNETEKLYRKIEHGCTDALCPECDQ